MLHSEVYHRYYTIPFLHGAPCVSAVCLWWQRQQCTSRWRTRVTLEVQTEQCSITYRPTGSPCYLAGPNSILSALTTLSFTCIYRETKIKLLSRDWERNSFLRQSGQKSYSILFELSKNSELPYPPMQEGAYKTCLQQAKLVSNIILLYEYELANLHCSITSVPIQNKETKPFPNTILFTQGFYLIRWVTKTQVGISMDIPSKTVNCSRAIKLFLLDSVINL